MYKRYIKLVDDNGKTVNVLDYQQAKEKYGVNGKNITTLIKKGKKIDGLDVQKIDRQEAFEFNYNKMCSISTKQHVLNARKRHIKQMKELKEKIPKIVGYKRSEVYFEYVCMRDDLKEFDELTKWCM